jgi:hypothetical protein
MQPIVISGAARTVPASEPHQRHWPGSQSADSEAADIVSLQSEGEGADIVEGISGLSSPSHVGDSTAGLHFFSNRVRSAMSLADVSGQSSLSSLPAHMYALDADSGVQRRAHPGEADSDAALAAMTLTLSPVQHATSQRMRVAGAESRAAAGASLFSTPSLDMLSTPSLNGADNGGSQTASGGGGGGGEQTRMSSEAIERHLLLTSDEFDFGESRDFSASYARLSPLKALSGGARHGSATPSSWYACSDTSDREKLLHAADVATIDTPRLSESSQQEAAVRPMQPWLAECCILATLGAPRTCMAAVTCGRAVPLCRSRRHGS